MAAWRVVALLLTGCLAALGQDQDIYLRVKRVLGDKGEAELRAKNFAQVDSQLTAIKPSSESERAEILALQGALAFLEGDMARAASAFRDSEKLHPAREGDRFTLAMALVRLGDETGARTELSGLAKEHDSTAIYWYWLGRIDYDQRRYTEAADHLQKAVQLDPKSARGWDSLGLVWDMQGQMEKARELFEKAVSLNRQQAQPSAWPPHNLGYLLLRAGEPAQAEVALRESLKYDESLARTHYYLARSLEKEEKFDEAVAEYRIAIAGDKTSADSCYSLAMLYQKLHRDAEAKMMFAEFKARRGSGAESQTSH